jgi:hypothetical protein
MAESATLLTIGASVIAGICGSLVTVVTARINAKPAQIAADAGRQERLNETAEMLIVQMRAQMTDEAARQKALWDNERAGLLKRIDDLAAEVKSLQDTVQRLRNGSMQDESGTRR